MKINQPDLITVPRSRKLKPGHYQFIGASDARIINSLDEAALIRLWTGDLSPARAAKSPTAQALLLRPIRVKSLRTSHKQRQTAAKLPTLMSGIRSFMKAYAILWKKLYAAGFKTSPHHVERCATRLMRTCLELAHSYNADTRLFGEFLLAPIKEAASGSALRR